MNVLLEVLKQLAYEPGTDGMSHQAQSGSLALLGFSGPGVERVAKGLDELEFGLKLMRQAERFGGSTQSRSVADMRGGEDGMGRREEGMERIEKWDVVVQQAWVS
jgi:hypothetical protein